MSIDVTKDFPGAPEALVAALTASPDLATSLKTYIEGVKEPLAKKNNELLGELKPFKDLVGKHGGLDVVSKTLENPPAPADTSALTKRIETLTTNQKNAAVTAAITSAVTAAKGSEKLLAPHIRTRLSVEMSDNDEVSITVLDANGKPWVKADNKPASLADLLEDMKKDSDFAKGFAATDSSGGGAVVVPDHLRGVNNPWAKATWNLTEQGKVLQSNPALAASLKANAGAAA